MSRQLIRLGYSLLVGVAIVTLATVLQPRFVAGSIADLLCELFLLPGKLFAILFHDRGTASPEFLWRSRVATATLFSGIAYWLVRPRSAQL